MILEVALLVTDWNFNVLATYESVINQPQIYIDRMDDWNKEHHTKSGLIQKIPYGKILADAEEDILKIMSKYFPYPAEKNDRAILAGNSIAQDRLFIDKYMHKLAARLHYRMLDVSAWKIVFNNKFGIKYEKKNAHRALDDIQESIAELNFYLQHLDLHLGS